MITPFPADLHIHTPLSPCAEREMNPSSVYAKALAQDLRIIAITDHNSTANLPGFCQQVPAGLWVIPGIEVQTKEEVHMVCLFPDLERAMACGEMIRRHLPPVENNPDYFGEQTILDAEGKKIGEEKVLLLNSVTLSIDDLLGRVDKLGGISYPAHVDRPSFSLLSQLGFIPPGLKWKVMEISRRAPKKDFAERYPEFTLIRASDSHRLSDLAGGGRTLFYLAEPCWEEFLAAFASLQGRKVIAC